MRIVLVLLLISLSGGLAQEQSGTTFKSGVTMIQVPVVVRDRDGRTVNNLEKDDFQLFDDGKLVEIASFAVENPGSQTAPDRSLPGAQPAAPRPQAGTAMDIPEHFIAYFFDDVSIGFVDMKRLRDAAARQIAELQPGDRVGVFTSSCSVLLDFTNDQAKLQEAVSRLAFAPPGVCRVSRVQVLQVEVLGNLIRRMSVLPARREIILVSPGFWVGHDRSPEAANLIESAVRAKVVIHALDTGGSTDYAGPGAAAAGPDFNSQARATANPTAPMVLLDLTHGTGGTYVTGNDFAVGFRRLATPESHYVLSFVPTGKADGRLHQLKVKLENGRKLTVEARSQYYAGQP